MNTGSNFGAFRRPVGARADMRELLYVSALLQTGTDLRDDGTVTATDIQLYMRSRYGLHVPKDYACDIVRGLGGTHGKRKRKEDGGEDIGEETAPARGSEHPSDTATLDTGVLERDVPSTDYSKSNDLESGLTGNAECPDDDLHGQVSSTGEQEVGKGVKNVKQSAETLKRILHIAKKKESSKEDSLDIVQLTCSLLIPTLLRATEAAEIGEDAVNDSHADTTSIQEEGRPVSCAGRGHKTAEQKEPAALKSEKDALQAPPQQILQNVLCLMLSNMEGTCALKREVAARKVAGKKRMIGNELPIPQEVTLSEDLVRMLLETFLEFDAACDDVLVRAMVEAAGGDGVLLDEHALGRALTSDVTTWKVGVEDELSETFVDVFGFDPVDSNEYRLGEVVLQGAREAAEETVEAAMGTSAKTAQSEGLVPDTPRYIPTAPYIDYVADSNRGLGFLVLLWVFFLFCIAIVYMVLGGTNFQAFQCGETFGCELAHQLFRWLVLGSLLVAGGVGVITPVSLGNDPYQKSYKIMSVSVFCQLVFCVIPYVAVRLYKNDIPHGDEPSTIEKNMSRYYFEGALDAFLILGCLLAVRLILFIVTLSTPVEKAAKWSHFLQRINIPVNTRMSAAIKRAATCKLNNLLENAKNLHSLEDRGKKVTNAEENFISIGLSYEQCGGLIWTWQRMWSNDIMTVEGVWIHSRLIVGQMGQLISMVFLAALWIVGTERLAHSAEEHRELLYNDRPSHSRDWALWMTPEGWMIEFSFFVGGCVAFVVAIALVLIYLPSTVSTILKLRSGVIPSLEDSTFPRYRSQADKIFYNVGNMVYALIGSAALFFAVFAGILFLFVWPPSKETMLIVLAWCIGLGLTIGLKMVLMNLTRSKFHTALFRTQPRAANFNALAMECWNIGLGGGILISRITQFFFAACFWIGRIDVTFLDEDVKMVGYQFDYTPKHFRKEILVHDAHRHPYIDRLGGMFMMRLKHGTDFCSDAGATWRILFVLTLMPWMRKYRRGGDQNEDEDGVLASLISLSASLAGKEGNEAVADLLENVADRVRTS